MKLFVVDTSALLRLYVPDGPCNLELEPALALAVRAEAAIVVPELLLAEVAQVLLKKERAGALATAEAEAILDAVKGLPLDVVGHRTLLRPAGALARTHSLSIYDALYLALAVRHGAPLLSCDARLVAAAAAISR